MKRVLCISLILLLNGIPAMGAKNVFSSAPNQKNKKRKVQEKVTRGNVQIIEATENIRYLSQRLTKEYLFFYLNPENERIHKRLYASLDALEENLRAISMVTKDQDTQNILEFLAYSKEEIATLLEKKPTRDTAALMLDYSETLLEGADSIGKSYAYTFSKEEQMLVASKNIKYLLERIAKYYLALKFGFDTENNRETLEKASEEIETYFVKFEDYPYPENMKKVENLVRKIWLCDNRIVKDEKEYFIPSLLLDSITFFEDKVDVLERYHSKNL